MRASPRPGTCKRSSIRGQEWDIRRQHAVPRSYPFSSTIRVDCEHGAAEYAFSAAPAEGGGNIGEAQGPPGLRLYPADGKPVTVPVASADPWGPEISYFVECIEQGRDPEQGTGEQAREALRVARRESVDRERTQRDRMTSADDGAVHGQGRSPRTPTSSRY